jgi:phage terminase large subunit-like protein
LTTITKLQAVADYLDYKSTNKLEFFKPYDWQVNFYSAGLKHRFRMLMAANRVGKTLSQAYEVAYHLTGLYPEDWNGIKFTFPPNIWALGVSGEQIRDVLQAEMLGTLITREGFTGTGAIPKHLIGDYIPAMGTPRLTKEVKVKHVSGSWSSLGFRSYTQGQHVLMGTAKDYIWIDEEPEDPEIVPQCIVRLTTGNKGKGGYMALTMTPENGETELITSYTKEDKGESKYLLNVTWDDAPHLDEQAKKDILSGIPKWQHDMRSKGIPLMGEGMVYPISEDEIKIADFEIPVWYKLCAAIDFGIAHPTAGAWCAYDPDNDIIYVTSVYAKSGEIPAVHAATFNGKGKNIPVVFPHDGDNTEKGSGKSLRDIYANECGVNMHIKFSNEGEGDHNYVEAGIMYLHQRMATGRFKVFASCTDYFSEHRRYHRKKGKIVKEHDDVIDAVRYAACSVTRFGVTGRKRATNIRMSPNLGKF